MTKNEMIVLTALVQSLRFEIRAASETQDAAKRREYRTFSNDFMKIVDTALHPEKS